jgi:hypothetical protein
LDVSPSGMSVGDDRQSSLASSHCFSPNPLNYFNRPSPSVLSHHPLVINWSHYFITIFALVSCIRHCTNIQSASSVSRLSPKNESLLLFIHSSVIRDLLFFIPSLLLSSSLSVLRNRKVDSV